MNKYLVELLKTKAELERKVLDLYEDLKHGQRVQKQRCEDCLIMAMEELEVHPDLGRAIFNQYLEEQKWVTETVMEDVKDDKQFWYTKEKVDRAVKKYCEKSGIPFRPWEERFECKP